ncbi:hypothetical protein VTO73DRAFT_13800 [Trametes versicolor]
MAELIAAYQNVRTYNIIAVVIATLLVHDALLCMDMEVRYVWRSPKASRKLSKFLYIYNQYMSILWNLLSLVLIGTISDTILWENGNIYFCTLVAMNIADMVLTSVDASIFYQAEFVIELIDPISAILNSRFLLALYETNTHLERGGSSASSFSTLDFGGADSLRAAVSPELPEFLNSLPRPIHSLPDHDPEMFDPEPTMVQQEREGEVNAQSQSEVGAQGQVEPVEVGEGSEQV